jgi:hypothetical protein
VTWRIDVSPDSCPWIRAGSRRRSDQGDAWCSEGFVEPAKEGRELRDLLGRPRLQRGPRPFTSCLACPFQDSTSGVCERKMPAARILLVLRPLDECHLFQQGDLTADRWFPHAEIAGEVGHANASDLLDTREQAVSRGVHIRVDVSGQCTGKPPSTPHHYGEFMLQFVVRSPTACVRFACHHDVEPNRDHPQKRKTDDTFAYKFGRDVARSLVFVMNSSQGVF